jgi:hypothetical protein
VSTEKPGIDRPRPLADLVDYQAEAFVSRVLAMIHT